MRWSKDNQMLWILYLLLPGSCEYIHQVNNHKSQEVWRILIANKIPFFHVDFLLKIQDLCYVVDVLYAVRDHNTPCLRLKTRQS
ncbi:hypothetical protein FQZ97_983080 [compost metagenome]